MTPELPAVRPSVAPRLAATGRVLLCSCCSLTYLQRRISTGPAIASEGLEVSIPISSRGRLVRLLLVLVQGSHVLQALGVIAPQVFQGIAGELGGPLAVPGFRGLAYGRHAAPSASLGANTNLRLSNSGRASTRQPKASTATGIDQGSPPASCHMSCSKARRMRRSSSVLAAAAARAPIAASPALRCSRLRLMASRLAALGRDLSVS